VDQAGSVDQEVRGDQQQAVELVELAAVAVVVAVDHELEEKQIHHIQVLVVEVVQDRLVEMVVQLEFILVISLFQPELLEQQMLVDLAVMVVHGVLVVD